MSIDNLLGLTRCSETFPSTSELLDWLKLLLAEDVDLETLREKDARKAIPPLHGALLKNEQDVHMFERLAFLARREG